MTNKEAAEILKLIPKQSEAIKKAIEALEQEPILDKIRAEIAEIPKKYPMTMDYENGLKEALGIIDKYKAENEHKRTIDADELLKRIAEKCKTPSLSKDTVNGLCGATAIVYDMLNESGQEKDADKEVDNADSNNH